MINLETLLVCFTLSILCIFCSFLTIKYILLNKKQDVKEVKAVKND